MSYKLRHRTSSSNTTMPASTTTMPTSDRQSEMGWRENDSYKWIQGILRTSWMTYILVLLGAVFGGGSMIRLYGNTCGLNLLDPSSWLRAFVTIGSPWCRALNWVGYMATSIVEHLWFHLFGVIISTFVTFVPGKMISLSAGNYDGRKQHEE